MRCMACTTRPDICELAVALTRALALAADYAEVSRIAASHATRFPHILSVTFRPDSKLPGVRSFQSSDGHAAPAAVVTAHVAANGTTWGSLAAKCSSEEPSSRLVAELLAQQLALALNRIREEAASRALNDELRLLSDEVQTRKVLHRARGVVARWYGISEKSAEVRIRALGRTSGRSVQAVAHAVIEAETLPVFSEVAHAGAAAARGR